MNSFAQPVSDEDRYLNAIKKVIYAASNGAERSQQKSIGPSEIGDPCLRKLAHKLIGTTAVNADSDPLPSAVGTGAHAWMADAFERDNQRLIKAGGQKRWWVETKVQAGAIRGSCDLYDADNRLVLDHKFPGVSSMKKYAANGPSQVYRIQAHMYGLGHEQAGRDVDTVAIAFYPRGGNLHNAFVWSEPYDEQIARDALDRLAGLGAALDAWQQITGSLTDAIAAVPATPSFLCGFCDFFAPNPTDLLAGCPGEGRTT